MESTGPVETGQEGVYQYLREAAAKGKPFFLVISLVNPHDVLFYPNQWAASGYSDSLLQGPATLPATYAESLNTKPAVQGQWANLNLVTGVATDAYLLSTLNLMDELGLTENTVVSKCFLGLAPTPPHHAHAALFLSRWRGRSGRFT